MPPISLKYVISFSAQDPRYPVENVISGDQSKRWLSAPGDRNGVLEAEFQLERSCQISHLDIGTIWTLTMEVSVGKSSWPRGKEFETLLPTCTFLNPVECRQLPKSQLGFKIRMFKADNFCEAGKTDKYDRIRVRLLQPLRKDVQFGLCVLKVFTEDTIINENMTPNSKSRDQSELQAQAIQKHFFGSKSTLKSPEASIRSQLAKLESSSMVTEDDTTQVVSSTPKTGQMSRTAQLVIAAVGKNKQFKPKPLDETAGDSQENAHSKTPLKGSLSARKRKLLPPIEDEMKLFLDKLDVSKLDLDTVQISDLRHKFEKVKCRKLMKEEKKTFVSLVKEFMQRVFGEEPESPLPPPVPPCQRKTSSLDATPSPPRVYSNKNVRNNASSTKHQRTSSSSSISGVGSSARRNRVNDVTNGDTQNRIQFSKADSESRTRDKGYDEQRWFSKASISPGGGQQSSGRGRGSGRRTGVAAGTPTSGRGARRGLTGGNDVRAGNERVNAVNGNFPDKPHATTHSRGNYSGELVMCPICAVEFPVSEIGRHAASCGILISSDSESDDAVSYIGNGPSRGNGAANSSSFSDATAGEDTMDCPLCRRSYPLSVIQYHADACGGHF